MLKPVIIKIYFTFGLLSLILAIIGMVLPIMPTTPFALLAIFFFSRSSEKFHNWCLNIPGFGDKIKDWQKHKIIRTKSKLQAFGLMLVSAVIILLNDNIQVNIKAFSLISLLIISIVIMMISSKVKPK